MNKQKLLTKVKENYYWIIAPISLEVETDWKKDYKQAVNIIEEKGMIVTDDIYFFQTDRKNERAPLKVGIKNDNAYIAWIDEGAGNELDDSEENTYKSSEYQLEKAESLYDKNRCHQYIKIKWEKKYPIKRVII